MEIEIQIKEGVDKGRGGYFNDVDEAIAYLQKLKTDNTPADKAFEDELQDAARLYASKHFRNVKGCYTLSSDMKVCMFRDGALWHKQRTTPPETPPNADPCTAAMLAHAEILTKEQLWYLLSDKDGFNIKIHKPYQEMSHDMLTGILMAWLQPTEIKSNGF